MKKEQKLIFYEAETASVFWETNLDTVKGLFPKPLKPPKSPLATAFVGQWANINFTMDIRNQQFSLELNTKDSMVTIALQCI